VTPADPIDLAPDLTLAEACERWGVSSRNTIKARAKALGVELRIESTTRTVWPAEYVPLGDQLAEHLKQRGGTLANFPGSVTALDASSDGGDGVSVMAPPAASDRGKRSGGLAVTAPAAGTDALAALAQLAAAMAPQPPADPLAVARGLREAAELGAWLTTAELAQLLKVSPGTPAAWWKKGQAPRPGFALDRRKVAGAVWWRVSASTD
jgi:hypothetical protein